MSTVVFKSYKEFESAEYGSSFYGRVGTPTTLAFEESVAALEGAHGSVSTCSGLSAVVAALMAFTRAGDHVLMPDNCYGPGRRACEQILRRYGVNTEYYPPMIGAGIEKLFKPETKVVFLEAPGSFTYEVCDIGAIVGAVKKAGLRTVMDNSWATPLYFRPLDHGIDVALMSGTKYISGHSDAMLGVLSATKDAYPAVKKAVVHMGICPGSEEVYLGARGLRTLHVRLAQHCRSGLDIAHWLSGQKAVKRVLHPALPSCPGHENWQKYFKGSSGTFGIILHETDKERFARMLDGMQLFKMGFSWGGFESLLFPEQPGPSRSAEKWTEPGLSLRLHIGFEHVDDLKADLEAGLKRLG
jgi:cystathionine beta-lyase